MLVTTLLKIRDVPHVKVLSFLLYLPASINQAKSQRQHYKSWARFTKYLMIYHKVILSLS